jgi:metal transporter CNNM
MTPLNKVFMLPADARLNQQTMRAILASGHSRIPVYTRGDR